MKKITGLITTILLLTKIVLAQNANESGLIAQQINNIDGAGMSFEKASLFISSIERTNTYGVYEELNIDETKLRNLFLKNAEFIELSIPRAHDIEMKLMLKKHEVLTNDFILTATTGQMKTNIAPPAAVCYQGIIKGDLNSIVAITVLENEVNGVIANNEGNYNLGKLKNQNVYGLYNDKTMQLPLHFNCGNASDNVVKEYTIEQLSSNKLVALSACQKVYLVCDNDLYVAQGSSFSNVFNYTVSLFNVVQTLYNNEGINMAMSHITIWQSPDPYCSTSSLCALSDFKLQTPFTNGDNILCLLAMDAGGNGGRADLGSLTCAAAAYADIDGSFASLPTYSWDVNVVTHEMGHNLNSTHTHECSWNGNLTAIDNCNTYWGSATFGGPITNSCSGGFAFPLGTGGLCSNGPSPGPGGGTIMSYCHGCANIGINFANGFGPQPGSVIRNFVANALCFTNCTNTCLYNIYVGAPITSGNSANYSASNTVYSATTLASGSNVQFNAGTLVKLNPGFVSENGSIFHASIAACTPLNISNTFNNDSGKKQSDGSIPENEFQVSPNPFHSNFDLSFNLKQVEKTTVIIYNMIGVKVKEINLRNLSKGFNKISFDCNDLVSGVYIIEIYLDGITTVKRIVKN